MGSLNRLTLKAELSTRPRSGFLIHTLEMVYDAGDMMVDGSSARGGGGEEPNRARAVEVWGRATNFWASFGRDVKLTGPGLLGFETTPPRRLVQFKQQNPSARRPRQEELCKTFRRTPSGLCHVREVAFPSLRLGGTLNEALSSPRERKDQFKQKFAMSSDNASSAVTYTSISSYSNGPSSWGISLMNTGELPEMDPYEEVAQQGQAHLLSPAYVPNPIELDEHVLVYVPDPEHPEYHAPSDDDIQVEDQPYADEASLTAESPGYITDSDSMEEDTDEDSIDYPDEPENGEEDDDEDLKEDPSEEHEPEDDEDDDDTNDEDEEPIKDEEEEEHPTLANSYVVPVIDPIPSAGDIEAFETNKARKTIRLEPPMSASMEARIVKHAVAPIPPISPTYDQAPLGHKEAMIRMRDDIPEEDMPPRRRFILAAPPPGCDVAESSTGTAARAPRGQYNFVDTVEARQGLIRSPSHDARTITRAADRAEDVGYVRALQASKHRMMTSIEEVNLRVSYQAQVRRQESEDFYTHLHYARTDHRDIRLEIDVVRGQRTAYEIELHEVRQAYLSFEAWNRALLARLETLETHMSRMEWQCQRAKDDAVRQMMRAHVLEARAQIDTVEDTSSSC
ncbi:hypothetical protein Tco_1318404 [Tanacetum coccineum]